MDAAIVTGAASGLGLAIARKLVEAGCRVYGLGGDYSQVTFSHDFFVPSPCDLTDPEAVRESAEAILEREGNIYTLVNNAKILPSKPLEELTCAELLRVLRVNLEAPLVLTRLALPSLRRFQGCVVNIASTHTGSFRGGAAGALCDGALHRFGVALFEEVRQSGVRVTTLFPQTNRISAQGGTSGRRPAAIDLDGFGQAVLDIVMNRSGNAITEMVVRPQQVFEEGDPGVYEIPYSGQVKPATARELEQERAQARAEAEAREKAEEERRRQQSEAARERRARRDSEQDRASELESLEEQAMAFDEANAPEPAIVRDDEDEDFDEEDFAEEAFEEAHERDDESPRELADDSDEASGDHAAPEGESGVGRKRPRRRGGRGRSRRKRTEEADSAEAAKPGEERSVRESRTEGPGSASASAREPMAVPAPRPYIAPETVDNLAGDESESAVPTADLSASGEGNASEGREGRRRGRGSRRRGRKPDSDSARESTRRPPAESTEEPASREIGRAGDLAGGEADAIAGTSPEPAHRRQKPPPKKKAPVRKKVAGQPSSRPGPQPDKPGVSGVTREAEAMPSEKAPLRKKRVAAKKAAPAKKKTAPKKKKTARKKVAETE